MTPSPAPALHSPRLDFRPFEVSDAEELLALFQDADVRRYLLDDQLVDGDWVAEEIEQSRLRFAEGSAGLWCIRATNDGAVVGFVGFRPFFDPPRLQLLYGFYPEYWGRGFASESAEAACALAFAELGFESVEAAIDTPNEASGRVLDRLGFTIAGETDDGPDGTVVYRLERPR
ncbi:MAG: GNAT family N-acetyltransferase [Gemmatimonadota bacterium]